MPLLTVHGGNSTNALVRSGAHYIRRSQTNSQPTQGTPIRSPSLVTREPNQVAPLRPRTPSTWSSITFIVHRYEAQVQLSIISIQTSNPPTFWATE